MMVFIRSNLDPNIDENDPETIESFISYINREQYGDHHFNRERRMRESPNGKQYSGAWDFFWNYQISEMYVRYFVWNFGGIEQSNDFNRERKRADPSQFWYLPLLLGFIGAYYHFARDWENGLAVFVLFFMTGLAIVLYLNQPDPQPRERDYSYVGSFFAFAIWVGIGASALMEWSHEFLKKQNNGMANAAPWLVFVLLLAVPFRMFSVNFHNHNRTGNYVASDYSYNMLINSDKNGIIFTNGDNDTFPLWYLQEVDNVRPDVRVANLSLMNTPWYIDQLKNKEPKVPISLNEGQIKNINLYPWPKPKDFEVPTIPESIRKSEEKQFKLVTKNENPTIPDKMVFKVNPKIQVPTRGGGRMGALRIQDYMILNILTANRFQKPLYFAVTSSDQNRMDGLKDFQRMDGLLFKITTIPGWQIDPDVLYDNLMHKFRYRNLNNPDVHYNENIIGLLQNYRSAFFRLSNYYLQQNERDKFKEVMQKLYEVMPPEVIPFTNDQFADVLNSLAFMSGIYPLDDLTAEKYGLRQLQAAGEVALNYEAYEIAKVGYERLLEVLENQPESAQVQTYLRALFRRASFFDQATPEQRQEALKNAGSQVKRQLVRIYSELKEFDSGINLLEKWLEAEPENTFAKTQMERLKELKNAAEANSQ